MRNVLLLTAFAALLAVASCSNGEARLSASERALINDGEGPMRVTTINDREDSILLRTPSVPIPVEEVKSEEIRTLLARMLATVTSPEQDGVGIAAPQVGINRRITLVMRYDKPGQPFEPFVNMQIDSLYGTVNLGPEGCLSVPGLRGDVPRWSDVIVSWTDTASLERRREHITGYTAIICQHEHDHLDGILYIDKAENLR